MYTCGHCNIYSYRIYRILLSLYWGISHFFNIRFKTHLRISSKCYLFIYLPLADYLALEVSEFTHQHHADNPPQLCSGWNRFLLLCFCSQYGRLKRWFQIEYGMNSTDSGDTGESRWASGWFIWCCLIWRTSDSWSWLRCRTTYCKTVNHSFSSQIVIMQRDSTDISDIICEGSWRSHSFDLLDVGGTVVKEGHAGEGMA